MTEVNVPLLRKVVEWAETEAAKPRELCEWEQAFWVSDPQVEIYHDPERLTEIGLAGYPGQSIFVRETYEKAPECGTCFCIAGYTASITLRPGEWIDDVMIVDQDGDVCTIPDRAAEELGIRRTSAHANLFSANNSIEDVRRIAEELAGERL